MKILDDNGLNFIKSFEGCVLNPYLDTTGTPTIGWGMTYYPDSDKYVTLQDSPLTQAQADAYFVEMVKPYEEAVSESCTIFLTQNQFNALTDFAYNLGVGALKSSVLIEHINSHCMVESDFTEYDHANGKVSEVLLKRRQAEFSLFVSNTNIMENTPTPAENATAPGPVVTPATAQTVVLNTVKVFWTRTENGETATGETDLPITPEIVAAFTASADNVGWNITVEAASVTA